MIKVINILLVLVMVFALVSCNNPFQSPPPPAKPPVVQPTTPVVTPIVVVSKPIIYFNSKTGTIGWNKEARKLLETTHVLHIQYGHGYNILNIRDGTIQMADWPSTWSKGPYSIGIYNPSTGKYAVSIRIE